MSALIEHTLVGIAQAIREKRVSSVEVTRAALDRAKAIDARYRAFIRIDEERALAAAKACDDALARGMLRGPLHGVPLAHKDMFYREDEVCTCGSAIRANWNAGTTATVLARLDAAGAVQIGTLNLTEFAYGPTGQNAYTGDARNPWNPDYITGGSSSGAGVAVAARVVFAALGSDTAGSVRLPSSICGVTGMKTTFGRVSRHGAMPLSATLDTVGPLTRTVADNALMLGVIAGHDPNDASTSRDAVPDYTALIAKPVRGTRVGRPVGYFDAKLEPEVAAILDRVYEAYRKLGCDVIDVPMPDLDPLNAAGLLATWGDVIAAHGPWMRDRPGDYTAQTRGRIEVTLASSAQDYHDALRYRGKALAAFTRDVFSKVDALVAPVMSFPVPRLSEVDVSGGPDMMRIINEMTRLMRPVNYLGLPALSVPAGFTSNGLPCGFQIVGRPFAESVLYRLGAAYEREHDWVSRIPPVV